MTTPTVLCIATRSNQSRRKSWATRSGIAQTRARERIGMISWGNMLKEVILSTCMYMLSGVSTSAVFETMYDLKFSNGIDVLVSSTFDCYNNYVCPVCYIRCYKAVINKKMFSKIYCKKHKWVKFKLRPECWTEKIK